LTAHDSFVMQRESVQSGGQFGCVALRLAGEWLAEMPFTG